MMMSWVHLWWWCRPPHYNSQLSFGWLSFSGWENQVEKISYELSFYVNTVSWNRHLRKRICKYMSEVSNRYHLAKSRRKFKNKISTLKQLLDLKQEQQNLASTMPFIYCAEHRLESIRDDDKHNAMMNDDDYNWNINMFFISYVTKALTRQLK